MIHTKTLSNLPQLMAYRVPNVIIPLLTILQIGYEETGNILNVIKANLGIWILSVFTRKGWN